MIYRFFMEGAKAEHEFEAVVSVTAGEIGDRWTPPSGPEIEVESHKVYDGDRSYYRAQVFMIRGKRRRLLEGCLADKVADLLLDHHHDNIIEQDADASAGAREEAAEAAWEMRRGR
jgi:hypothetical protein